MVAREGFRYAALLQQRHTKYGRPKQHVYQVSLKSETAGFNPLGDLTQNDPLQVHTILHSGRNVGIINMCNDNKVLYSVLGITFIYISHTNCMIYPNV